MKIVAVPDAKSKQIVFNFRIQRAEVQHATAGSKCSTVQILPFFMIQCNADTTNTFDDNCLNLKYSQLNGLLKNSYSKLSEIVTILTKTIK